MSTKVRIFTAESQNSSAIKTVELDEQMTTRIARYHGMTKDDVIAALDRGESVFTYNFRYERADVLGNKAMWRKLQTREAIDVRHIGTEIAPGIFELRDFIEDVDYCDATNEAWIWSIGRHHETGAIHASTSTRYYQNPDYTCLFLR